MKVSFRCYFPDGHWNQHYENVHIRDIHLWAMAYKFTHPNCKNMTIQLKWPEGGDSGVSGDGGKQHDRQTEDDLQL